MRVTGLSARRKAYYFMSIHEHMPPEARRDLKEVSPGSNIAKSDGWVAFRSRITMWTFSPLHASRLLCSKSRQRTKTLKHIRDGNLRTGGEAPPWVRTRAEII